MNEKQMTLGEAMILGQTLLTRHNNSEWLDRWTDGSGNKHWCGCAFGGALLAVGLGDIAVGGGVGFAIARSPWSWLQPHHLDTITQLYATVLDKQHTIEEMAAICDGWAPVATPAMAPIKPKQQPEPEPEPVTAPATGGHLFGRIWDVMSMR
jgi:hypothetical protein